MIFGHMIKDMIIMKRKSHIMQLAKYYNSKLSWNSSRAVYSKHFLVFRFYPLKMKVM